MGYAGGSTPSPTYRRIGDHAETFEIDFDPEVVSLEELLDVFWSLHDPTRPVYSTQYASAIFYRSEAQRCAAERSRDAIEVLAGRPVLTRIAPFDGFALAEEYHQKYRLRSDRVLMAEFERLCPTAPAFIDSTAAARVNGYLQEGAHSQQLERILPSLGLSENAASHLIERCRQR